MKTPTLTDDEGNKYKLVAPLTKRQIANRLQQEIIEAKCKEIRELKNKIETLEINKEANIRVALGSFIAALSWIEAQDPVTVASAKEKFHITL